MLWILRCKTWVKTQTFVIFNMPIKLHRSTDRGYANHGWLDTRHSFSFASWYNPEHMGIGPLRVLNQDVIAGGSGFPSHGHKDMEIISIVLDGALEHRDSEGNQAVIRPGEIQRMSAGNGVTHSETNHYQDRPTEFLQIWIVPEKTGIEPSYQQMAIDTTNIASDQTLSVLASPNGAFGGVSIHQDATIYGGDIDAKTEIKHKIKRLRLGYFYLPKGGAVVNGMSLSEGDGLYINGPEELDITLTSDSYVLLFDLGNDVV